MTQHLPMTARTTALSSLHAVIALETVNLRELARTSDLRGATFSGRLVNPDAQGLDLRGADFSGAVLTGAQFQGARLGGANFSGAQLDCANLNGASVAGAVFTDARLKYCNVRHTVFEDAVLYRTQLSGTRLTSPQLHAANTLGTEMVLCALLGRELGLAAELRGSLEAGQGSVPALEAALNRHTDLDGAAVRRWVMDLIPGTPPGHAALQLTTAWIRAWEARRARGWN